MVRPPEVDNCAFLCDVLISSRRRGASLRRRPTGERVRQPMRPRRKTAALCAAAGLALFTTACGKSNSPTTPTRTPAAASKSERYVATMGVGGSSFYSFSVSQYGTVNVTLTAVSGADDPSVAIGLGLGVP